MQNFIMGSPRGRDKLFKQLYDFIREFGLNIFKGLAARHSTPCYVD